MDAAKKRNLWTVSDSYSVETFYTKATDEKGHSSSTRLVRIPPAIMQQVMQLIETRQVPAYASVSDFYRDAIVHRLAWLRENVGSASVRERLDEVLQRIHLEEMTQAYAAEIQFFHGLKEKVTELAEQAIQVSDFESLRTYLTRLRSDVDGYREPFRSSLLDLIKTYEDKIQ